MNDSNIDNYINSHPRESLRLLIITLIFLWQSSVAVVGLAGYYLLLRLIKLQWWLVLLLGAVMAIGAVYYEQYYIYSTFNILDFIKKGITLNFHIWHLLLTGNIQSALSSIYHEGQNYLIGFSLFVVGILGSTDLIKDKPHKEAIKALQDGKIHQQGLAEVSHKRVENTLSVLRAEDFNGTLLGVSQYSGAPIVVPDKEINEIILVLGTTGGGKTITLRRFYQRAITQGYPLIIVDGKPSDENVEWLMKSAKQHGRTFYGFNCGNNFNYDCLANGGYTELKDKIICLKDEWASDYYRSIAEDYLQTTFQVLLASGSPVDLKTVVECLNYEDMALLARQTNDKNIMKRVASLEHYDRKDITGLQAHLNILIHSELGHLFEKNNTTFNLADAINQNAVVYFALPALRFPSFSKVLGKLVINDLKAMIDRQTGKRVFTVFDEFSVFAGDQVLNLVNMGRGKGAHAIFGTQGLADLEKVDKTFKSQVLNCANTIICHRLNDQESAEGIANWVGTQNAFTVTAQLSINQGDTGMGSVRSNKEFIVHPDSIKQSLQAGEAFYISKVGTFRWDKVKVKFE